MPLDNFHSKVEKLREVLNEFETDAAKYYSLSNSTDFDDAINVLRVMELKKLSFYAVRNYETSPKQGYDEEKCIRDLQTVISRILAIQKVRDLAYGAKYLEHLILRQSTDSIKKKMMLNKLSHLQQYQSKLVDLAKQDRIAQLDIYEARSQLLKELVVCKATMEKKVSDEKPEALAKKEEKINRRIEKINIMRKLMIDILLSEDAPLSDEWLDFFPSLRDAVTMNTFRD